MRKLWYNDVQMREFLPEQDNYDGRVPYVVHGSFRKHLGEIGSAAATINATGRAIAIAPHDCTAVGEEHGFILLAGENDKDPRQIEAEYLQKVLGLKALGGFSLWVNPGGYIGKAAAYEYGIAQASGVPTFFTETPSDVPFYVDPSSVKSPGQIAEQLQQSHDALLKPTLITGPLGGMWNRLPFPVTSVAVGGIIRCREKLLLIEDGRWKDGQLTVPGTTVRARETREDALHRAVNEKFGIHVSGIAPLKTSFMLDNSGYKKPISSLVFDDRLIAASDERVQPQDGLNHHWVTLEGTKALLSGGQIEPNAATLLDEYLPRMTV